MPVFTEKKLPRTPSTPPGSPPRSPTLKFTTAAADTTRRGHYVSPDMPSFNLSPQQQKLRDNFRMKVIFQYCMWHVYRKKSWFCSFSYILSWLYVNKSASLLWNCWMLYHENTKISSPRKGVFSTKTKLERLKANHEYELNCFQNEPVVFMLIRF